MYRTLEIYIEGELRGSGTVDTRLTDLTLKKSSGNVTLGVNEAYSERGTLNADVKEFYLYRSANLAGE